MKTPKPRKLSSGKYFIQMRLGGESISVSDWDEKKCIREAQHIKAEYLAGKRLPPPEPEPEAPKGPTLTEAIDLYIESRSNVLSPSTIRGYRSIQKNRFKDIMGFIVNDIPDSDWQKIINGEAKICSPKSLKNSFMFIRSVVYEVCRRDLPPVRLPAQEAKQRDFLTPEEIPLFVNAIKDTEYAIPLLLALSSCRMSEMLALKWEHIPKDPDFIQISGAIVLDENHHYHEKATNKNLTSTRSVPILIPELAEAIERDRKPNGPVLLHAPNVIRRHLHWICRDAGITDVTVHGLRHSFASLAYHLQIPERIAMDIGGWKNPATMHRIYTHISKSDITRYQNAMADFYKNKPQNNDAISGKNANKITNKK